MFSWLWPWGRAKAAPERGRTITASGVRPSARPPASGPDGGTADSFLAQLEQNLPLEMPLAPEQEEQISSLVVEIVEHVCKKKVDPPVMPALVPRVLAIAGEPEVDMIKLARLIEQDLAISAKLLSVANSAAFGASKEIGTVRDAIGFLGTEQVAQVAIGLACSSQFEQERRDPGGPLRARWTRLFQHGMSSAFSASHLAGKRDRRLSEQAFLGGLFHDVGKAVALRALEALVQSGKAEAPSEQVLDEILHRLHAYPGDEFYEKWTLPAPLMQICAEHHQLEALGEEAEVLHCVSLTSSFDALLFGVPAEQREAVSEIAVSARALGLNDAQLRAIHTQAGTLGDRTKRMFRS